MAVQSISAGAGRQHNEDFVAVHQENGTSDLIVIDGGTSVAERNYVDEVRGDVAWFAQEFAGQLAATLHLGWSQDECVLEAAQRVYEEFSARSRGLEVPAYAWPIAAMTWARIREVHGELRLQLYSLGDCTTLLKTAAQGVVDLDPFVNPQEAVLQAEIARLLAQGVTDAAERKARLMPMLRARREFQNSAASPSVLCLRPAGRFDARKVHTALPPQSTLLVMTDGFYRLVDPYGLHTKASLLARCEDDGVNAVLGELRSYEAAASEADALAVKRADDASAVMWQPD